MKIKEQIRNYYIALLTVFCLIMGSFGFLFYCSFGNWILTYILMQIVIVGLMVFVYKKVKSRFREEEWPSNVPFTGVLLPYILGSFMSQLY